MTLSGLSVTKKRRRAEELLEAVGLGDRKDHHLSQLSGGEQQRIAIAVSLANNPRLLLADEPTGEVDEATSQTIYKIFRQLNQEKGQTILIVSHDPGIAREVDRVVAIRDGKTAAETIRSTALRRKTGPGEEEPETAASEEHETEELFEELTVLDSAGRLQIPKEYLEHFGIRKRVRLELREDSISIVPISEADKSISAEDAVNELSEVKEQERLISRLERWWSKRGGKEKAE
jgi:ABC-type multidrug transport system ATPase subunit